MKRRLEDNDIKREGNGELQAAGGGGAVMSDDMKEMVAAMIAKELMQNLATASGSRTRFGNVGFEGSEQQNVNAFLHQKLGKGQLTRRPGPGGTRLTYIESCKAIELANKAFGFNGWSCRILECKEEYVRRLHCLQAPALLRKMTGVNCVYCAVVSIENAERRSVEHWLQLVGED